MHARAFPHPLVSGLRPADRRTRRRRRHRRRRRRELPRDPRRRPTGIGSLATNIPGQSGQPGSPFYGNLLPLWAENKYFPAAFQFEGRPGARQASPDADGGEVAPRNRLKSYQLLTAFTGLVTGASCSCARTIRSGGRALPRRILTNDRSTVDDQYKWDLTHLYPTDEAWRSAKNAIETDLALLKPYAGRLGTDATVLADALETVTRLSKEFARAYVYASMMSDTGHAGQQVPGHAAGDDAARRGVRRRDGVHRAGDSQAPTGRRSTASSPAEPRLQAVPRSTSTTSSAARAHTLTRRGRDACSPSAGGDRAARRRPSTASSPTPTFPTRPSR